MIHSFKTLDALVFCKFVCWYQKTTFENLVTTKLRKFLGERAARLTYLQFIIKKSFYTVLCKINYLHLRLFASLLSTRLSITIKFFFFNSLRLTNSIYNHANFFIYTLPLSIP